jgi:hypothetical protein
VINICDPSTVEESFCDSALLAIEEAFRDMRKLSQRLRWKLASKASRGAAADPSTSCQNLLSEARVT